MVGLIWIWGWNLLGIGNGEEGYEEVLEVMLVVGGVRGWEFGGEFWDSLGVDDEADEYADFGEGYVLVEFLVGVKI